MLNEFVPTRAVWFSQTSASHLHRRLTDLGELIVEELLLQEQVED